MTTQQERAERNIALRQALAETGTAHHEAAAAAEVDRSYADSGLVRGDVNDRLSPGELLPNSIPVRAWSGEAPARFLHELTHRPGHTVFALGGRGARCREVLEAIGRIEAVALASPGVDAVIGLCADPENPRIGRIDSSPPRMILGSTE
jgi:hypothetical protein